MSGLYYLTLLYCISSDTDHLTTPAPSQCLATSEHLETFCDSSE